MEFKTIQDKNYNELVCLWGDGTLTDIVYANRPSSRFKIKHDKKGIHSQFITYGTEPARELAEYIRTRQEQYKQRLYSKR